MEENNRNATTEKFTIEPEYFILLAIQKEMPWNTLTFMLQDLTTSLDRSKQVIRVLVQELEKLVLNVEKDSNQDVTDVLGTNENQDHNTEEDQDESIQSEHYKTVFDFPANEYYEFVGDDKEANSVSSEHEESELLEDETVLNNESEERHLTEDDRITTDTDTKREKKCQCNFCGKFFSQKSHVDSHEKIHTGEKPFECRFCPKLFSHKSTLEQHERTHTGEKPFQCQICKKCFSNKSTLKKHTMRHSGEKPFECTTCKKCFAQAATLKNHERIHTGDKPFKCLNCKASFRQSAHLKSHERLHIGEKL